MSPTSAHSPVAASPIRTWRRSIRSCSSFGFNCTGRVGASFCGASFCASVHHVRQLSEWLGGHTVWFSGPGFSRDKVGSSYRVGSYFMAYAARDLKGRTAVVIGGTSGIGLTLAKGLAEAGANVIATGRRKELVEEASKQIRAAGVRSLPLACDVSDRGS